MKIKCINNDLVRRWLTIGKTYDVLEIDKDGFYKILNDDGNEWWYIETHFKQVVAEMRNEKINKLLNY